METKNQKEIQKEANRIAREAGYHSADKIIFDARLKYTGKVVKHIRYGYRKYTTGEYVSNAYRNKFGWKNTYYQPALTIVAVPKSWLDN